MKDRTNALRACWKGCLLAIPVIAVMTAVFLSPRPASGEDFCDPARPHEAGDFDLTFDSGGLTREYFLHVPTSYGGEEAVPLLFNFHGLAGDSASHDVYSQLPEKAEEEGFILVTPRGLPNDDGYRHWNAWRLPAPEPDDIAFIDELLTDLQSRLCIDAARVFSTGLSNGGHMSSQLACSLPDRIAAIAPVAGTRFYGDPCSSRPVPVMSYHGTDDIIISYLPIAEEVIPAWAANNGCGPASEQDPLPGTVGVRVTRYEGCDQDATVEFYTVFDADLETPGEQGGGHTWPGSTVVLEPPWDQILGITSPEISANDLMWEFFQAHPMPGAPEPKLLPTPTSAPPPPPAVGGAGGFPEIGGASESGGDAGAVVAAVSAAVTACALTLGGAAWYARRRWLT
jgi:polyhydroxybutyrate depolymerase